MFVVFILDIVYLNTMANLTNFSIICSLFIVGWLVYKHVGIMNGFVLGEVGVYLWTAVGLLIKNPILSVLVMSIVLDWSTYISDVKKEVMSASVTLGIL